MSAAPAHAAPIVNIAENVTRLMPATSIAHTHAPTTVIAAPILEANHAVFTGPARIEVGVLNSAHGWLKVGAELGGGGTINTSLTVSSPTHDALRASLPEIANYLHSEGVNFARIDLHRAPPISATSENLSAQTESGSNTGERQRREDSSPALGDQPSQIPGAQPTASQDHGELPFTSASMHRWKDRAAPGLSYFNPSLMPLSGFTGGWVNLCA